MIAIKIYCMQKNEDDILDEWIDYHSQIVGTDNIYLIDNESTDNSNEIYKKWIKNGLHVKYEKDYKRKGDYIYEWIRENNIKYGEHIAIPLDIDEFIGLSDPDPNIEESVSILFKNIVHDYIHFDPKYYKRNINKEKIDEKKYIVHYLRNISNNIYLKTHSNNIDKSKELCIDKLTNYKWLYSFINKSYFSKDPIKIRDELYRIYNEIYLKNKSMNMNIHIHRFSFSHYLSSVHEKAYYENPIKEITNFTIDNIYPMNKKFFISSSLIYLDHGNHYGQLNNEINIKDLTQLAYNSYISNLFLFHYHNRGLVKLIDKCINDIKGLGYNINNYNTLLRYSKSKCQGNHNIKTYLKFLTEGTYGLTN